MDNLITLYHMTNWITWNYLPDYYTIESSLAHGKLEILHYQWGAYEHFMGDVSRPLNLIGRLDLYRKDWDWRSIQEFLNYINYQPPKILPYNNGTPVPSIHVIVAEMEPPPVSKSMISTEVVVSSIVVAGIVAAFTWCFF